MDEMAEQQDNLNEISNALGRGNNVMDDVSLSLFFFLKFSSCQDDLLEELGQLEAEELEAQLNKAGPVTTAAVKAKTEPQATQSAAPVVQAPAMSQAERMRKDEEDELAALQAQLS